MTTHAEYRALAERLAAIAEIPDDYDTPDFVMRADCRAAAFAILALLEERDGLYEWKIKAEQMDREKTVRVVLAESRLGKAVEALRQVSMACGLYGEDLSFGDMKTVHRIQERARTVLSDLEKSE